jgi:1-acylglycerone phosphate reductase
MMNSGYSMPLLDAELDGVRKLFELNVFAVLGTTQAFAPLLLKSKGTVVNISSVACFHPLPWQGAYCATKGAQTQISDTLRLELEPFGVKVIVVSIYLFRWEVRSGAHYLRQIR